MHISVRFTPRSDGRRHMVCETNVGKRVPYATYDAKTSLSRSPLFASLPRHGRIEQLEPRHGRSHNCYPRQVKNATLTYHAACCKKPYSAYMAQINTSIPVYSEDNCHTSFDCKTKEHNSGLSQSASAIWPPTHRQSLNFLAPRRHTAE